MLICPSCEKELRRIEKTYECPSCGALYPVRNGIHLFDKAQSKDDGYPEECFKVGDEKAPALFWFKKRNEAILEMFRRFSLPGGSVIEIGCASGLVTDFLSKHGIKASGAELHPSALESAGDKIPGERYSVDIRRLPFKEEFDTIGLFDVLEHIDDDALALQRIHNALKSSGVLILTVPAKMALWSSFDDLLCHCRRYELPGLKKLLEDNGFQSLKISYLFFLLYPIVYLNRLAKKKKGKEIAADDRMEKELSLPPIVNALFGAISKIEVVLLKYLNFPVGSTIIAVARKK